MDSQLKRPNIISDQPINLYGILDKSTISFNIGQECAKSTANNIGYILDPTYYSDPDFAHGYARSLGYIHGINGKEQNWSKSITPITKYNSIRLFEQSKIPGSAAALTTVEASSASAGVNGVRSYMNAVNSTHTFVVSGIYKQDYILGWLYGQFQVRWQHDSYSLEQQGFIHAQSDIKLDPFNILHINLKFILGFCAGRGYSDYKNFEIKKIVTFSKKFDELDLPKDKCQMYYDMFYTDI